MKIGNIPKWIEDNYKLVLLVFIIAIIIYLAWQLWYNSGKHIREGFADKELIDLLDKIRVNIFESKPIWDNKFYNNQPAKKEKQISFWKPQITPEIKAQNFRIIGSCVSDNNDYEMPSETTMLIAGDTRVPVDASEIFKFPQNSISDLKSGPLSGLDKFESVDTRIDMLDTLLTRLQNKIQDISVLTESVRSEIANMKTFDVILYSENSYFGSVAKSYTISPGQTINIPDGKYDSIRIPVGSTVTLVFEDNTTETISYPFDNILNATRPDKYKYDIISYSDVFKNIKSGNDDSYDIDKYMLFGKYAIGFMKDNTTTSTDNADARIKYKGSARACSTTRGWETSLNYGFGSNYDEEDIGIYGYGKSDLVPYFKNLKENKSVNLKTPTPTKSPTDSSTSAGPDTCKYMSGVDKDRNPVKTAEDDINCKSTDAQLNSTDLVTFWKRDHSNDRSKDIYFITDRPKIATYGNRYLVDAKKAISPVIVNSPHIYEKKFNTGLNDIVVGLESLKTIVTTAQASDTWLNVTLDDKSMMNTAVFKQYYLDLAFRYKVWTKGVRKISSGGCFVSSLSGNQSDIYDQGYVGITADGKDHGALKSMSITLDIANTDKLPYINYMNKVYSLFDDYTKTTISKVNNIRSQLVKFREDVIQNRLAQFPMRILRPSPPRGFVSLGDIIVNAADTNYTSNKPVLSNYGCVPEQCVKLVRDWLVTDRIYEYNRDNTYLAIYRNPYLQTFRAVTTPGIMPPGQIPKVVACVEKCKLVDDIIESDKCTRKFHKANKTVIESGNLDADNVVLSRESAIYKDKIKERQDKISQLQETARKLQIQDAKAEIVNSEYNRSKLQSLVGKQDRNINKLADKLGTENSQIDINVKFDYAKFTELIYRLDELPAPVKQQILAVIDKEAGKKLGTLSDETVNAVLAECPTPQSEGLVRKSLVESGCYGCANLQ